MNEHRVTFERHSTNPDLWFVFRDGLPIGLLGRSLSAGQWWLEAYKRTSERAGTNSALADTGFAWMCIPELLHPATAKKRARLAIEGAFACAEGGAS